MATEKTIENVWAWCSSVYPWVLKPLSGESSEDCAHRLTAQLVVWKKILGDVPDEGLNAAVMEYLGDSNEFFPAPGVLRQWVFNLIDRAVGKETDAMAAWEETRQHVREFYPGMDERYSKLTTWRDPIAERACKEVGGLVELKNISEGDIASYRARFIQAYQALMDRDKRTVRELPQITEARQVLRQLAEAKSVKQLEGGND